MKLRILSFLLMFSLFANAQALQHEKAFVCTEKLAYSAGDSIRIEGVLLNEQHNTMVYSNYAYVDVINDRDSVVVHQKLSLQEHGRFSTAVHVSNEWRQGLYFVRAYSRFMQNFSSATIPSVPIAINLNAKDQHSSSLVCDIFPEGKNVAKGVMQRYAVYIHTTTGETQPVSFKVTKDDGTELTSATTSASGWQIISVMPIDGQHLYLNTEFEGTKQSFLMPSASDKENIRLMVGKKNISYDIYGMKNRDYRLYIYNSSLGLLNIPKVSEHGTCLIDENLKGVVTLLLTDSKGTILSEASAWHDYVSNDDTTETTITRYVPVGTDDLLLSTAEQQVYFDNDLSSDMPFPERAFFVDPTKRINDINAWLFSADFVRLDMKEAIKGDFVYQEVPETSSLLSGQVTTTRGYIVKKGKVTAMCLDNGIAEEAAIGKDGRFSMNIPDFTDGDTFFLQADENKGNAENYAIKMDEDKMPLFENRLSAIIRQSFSGVTDMTTVEQDAKQLSEITVKGRARRVKYTEQDRFYKNRYIESDDLQKHNIISLSRMIETFFNMYMRVGDHYIFSRRPSVLDIHDKSEDYYKYTNGGLVPNEIPIILDGTQLHFYEADVQCIVDDIVYAEYLSPAMTLAEPGCHGCISGALVIRTGWKYKPVEKRKGTYYTPLGITHKASGFASHPETPGQYIMLQDRFSTDGNIFSKASVVTIPVVPTQR